MKDVSEDVPIAYRLQTLTPENPEKTLLKKENLTQSMILQVLC